MYDTLDWYHANRRNDLFNINISQKCDGVCPPSLSPTRTGVRNTKLVALITELVRVASLRRRLSLPRHRMTCVKYEKFILAEIHYDLCH
jgi:hypothetical protein